MVQINVQPMRETIQGQSAGNNSGMQGAVASTDVQGNISGKADKNQKVIMSTDEPSEKKVSEEGGSKGELPEKKKSHWWVWLLIVLLLLGAGVAAYFFIFKKNLI